MSNVVDLIKKSYFYGSDEDIERQIVDLVNDRCAKSSSIECIKEIIDQINVALTSEYVKETKSFYENKKIKIEDIRRELSSLQDVKSDLPISFLDEVRLKFLEVTEVEKQIFCIRKLEKLRQIISCIDSSILLMDLELSAEEVLNFIGEIMEDEFPVEKIELDILEKFYSSYDIIKTELTLKFEEGLNRICWPYITPGLEKIPVEKYHDAIDEYSSELSELFNQLRQIELPQILRRPKDNDENMIPYQTSNCNQNDEPFILWPVQLLLRKFIQYFGYFFCRPSKVNKLTKPEFYTNQILTWTLIHIPVIVRLFSVDYNVKLEFMRGLVLLVSHKIRSDLIIACGNDVIFQRINSHLFNHSAEKLNQSGNSLDRLGNSTGGSISFNTPGEMESENVLFHIIEESLIMHVELGQSCGYPNSVDVLPRISDQLLVDEAPNFVFQHWVSVEKRIVQRQLDELFRSSTLWKRIPGNISVKVECLVKISAILISMKDRITACHYRTNKPESPVLLDISEGSDVALQNTIYSSQDKSHISVPSDPSRLFTSKSTLSEPPVTLVDDFGKLWKLCEVFLEVIGDFRRRVVQVSKEASVGDKRWADVINVLYGICILMETWRLEPVFVSLLKYLHIHDKTAYNELTSRPSFSSSVGSFVQTFVSSQSFSIFSQQLQLTQHVLSILEGAWIDTVCEDVSARLVECCRTASRKGVFLSKTDSRGFSNEPIENRELIGAEPLLVLRDRLHQLHSYLESIIFRPMISQIAKKLDVCLLSRVIKLHRYSDSGAAIMAKQIVAYAITTFLPYTNNPERFFPESSEASKLLTLSWGTVVLLRDVIKRAYYDSSVSGNMSLSSETCIVQPITALKEAGVIVLDPLVALSILDQRVDPELFRTDKL